MKKLELISIIVIWTLSSIFIVFSGFITNTKNIAIIISFWILISLTSIIMSNCRIYSLEKQLIKN